jgi:putative ABC transport system ATP-binding protein
VTPGGIVLRIENVRKVRQSGRGEKNEILKGLSLSVPAGRLTVVVGPSGGGKSTLVRLLNRLDDPSSGRILLDGEDISAMDPLLLRQMVGLVSQKPFMYPGTVQDNLLQPFALRGEKPPVDGSGILRSTLGLCRLAENYLLRDARSLSIGEQQRVSLARVLMTRPQVLLLDEPTSALDRPTGDRLADTLRGICTRESLTVLMVTHDLRLAERTADRMAFLADGRILEEGTPDELLQNPRTQELKRFLSEPGKEGSGDAEDGY